MSIPACQIHWMITTLGLMGFVAVFLVKLMTDAGIGLALAGIVLTVDSILRKRKAQRAGGECGDQQMDH